MPRAWYSYLGPQNAAGYNTLSNYLVIFNGVSYYEPGCNNGCNVCAVYAIGTKVGGVQSTNPTNISYPLSLIAAAINSCESMPTNGGNNAQGRPFYVRVRFTE